MKYADIGFLKNVENCEMDNAANGQIVMYLLA